jgi:predicted DNA-binding transcriptional regulator
MKYYNIGSGDIALYKLLVEEVEDLRMKYKQKKFHLKQVSDYLKKAGIDLENIESY